MIESTSFGAMTIDGRLYTSDLILFPDGTVIDGWWRKRGHVLSLEDLTSLLEKNPALIVAGTGTHGRMRPHKDLANSLNKKGIAFIAEPNSRAMDIYNKKSAEKIVIGACFHLTC